MASMLGMPGQILQSPCSYLSFGCRNIRSLLAVFEGSKIVAPSEDTNDRIAMLGQDKVGNGKGGGMEARTRRAVDEGNEDRNTDEDVEVEEHRRRNHTIGSAGEKRRQDESKSNDMQFHQLATLHRQHQTMVRLGCRDTKFDSPRAFKVEPFEYDRTNLIIDGGDVKHL